MCLNHPEGSLTLVFLALSSEFMIQSPSEEELESLTNSSMALVPGPHLRSCTLLGAICPMGEAAWKALGLVSGTCARGPTAFTQRKNL